MQITVEQQEIKLIVQLDSAEQVALKRFCGAHSWVDVQGKLKQSSSVVNKTDVDKVNKILSELYKVL